MCFVKVKDEEEDYSVPARVVRRERRTSPPPTRRPTRASYVAPQQPSVERTYIIQAPPPPPPLVVEPPPPPSPPPASVAAQEPPRTQAHYVEVLPGSESDSSSEDARSRTTSKSRRTKARSEYRLREREYRRETGLNPPPTDDQYNHYRYVRAPPEREANDRGGYGRELGRDRSRDRRTSLGAKTSFVEDPRASRGSYRRERERVVIVDNDGRQTREYRR
ncbi:hypothetical protein BDV97DRAFT_73273 [Delphinella strobiligena]|nr:hypothetical protein BDV97DRAFT_73273 [Delphinella strobiligena]